jgi:hypothetical protein
MVNSTQGLKYSCFAKERIKIKAFSMKMGGVISFNSGRKD